MLAYSIGEMIDKLAVVHLKIWHIEENIRGKEKDKERSDEEIEELCEQVVSLNAQRVKIVSSIDEFFEKNE